MRTLISCIKRGMLTFAAALCCCCFTNTPMAWSAPSASGFIWVYDMPTEGWAYSVGNFVGTSAQADSCVSVDPLTGPSSHLAQAEVRVSAVNFIPPVRGSQKDQYTSQGTNTGHVKVNMNITAWRSGGVTLQMEDIGPQTAYGSGEYWAEAIQDGITTGLCHDFDERSVSYTCVW